MDASHVLVLVHLGQFRRLWRDQEERDAIGWKPVGEPIEHLQRRQLRIGETRPLDLKLLDDCRLLKRWREERGNLIR